MLAKELLGRLLTTARNRVHTNVLQATQQRFASTTSATAINTSINTIPLFDRALLHNSKNTMSVASVSEHVSRIRPFSVPAPPQPSVSQPTSSKVVEELELTSVLRKRRLKMNKHKHKKLRKRTRALRKKLGK
ncbi:unnamed protein product [Mucor circinelloides]|uniref:Small ribosomal subunit protein mS38 n=1 Tax=Mucor circinelloides f. circinelloides (strain 1006PhL) TaxID=1220926 RepID=S2K2Y9_MUCC1|nr:hypothetical protein HMPREF1544_06649 [Mucor circinelloides 1006PhL]